jgi:hypothetical protein
VHAFSYIVAFHPALLLARRGAVRRRTPPAAPHPPRRVELLLHPIISLVFEADDASPDVMRRPPVRPEAGC